MRRALVGLLALALTGSAAAAGPFPGTRTGKDRAAWRAILHWPAACEREWRTVQMPGSGIHVWRTAGDRRLVSVSCYLGAYQGTQRLYLVDARRHVTTLSFRICTDPDTGKPTATHTQSLLGVVTFAAGRWRYSPPWGSSM